ncbi:hypothetical protein ACQKGP_05575 [Lysinibacillus fusiformis]|uniref:hypothetical protein n=1 Tax=Lysinibacillus fusiformis TaxID=28031 RepID=UPI000A5AE0D8
MSKKLELCRWSIYVEVDWNVEWRRERIDPGLSAAMEAALPRCGKRPPIVEIKGYTL